jgi:hypothetical protein
MRTVIPTDQPEDKLTRRETLRLSAADVATWQGTAILAPAVTPASAAFSPATGRTFNLVPGFEAVPLIVAIQPGNDVGMRIEAVGA